MRVFKEKQRFTQWWLYGIYGLVLCVLIAGLYNNSDGFKNFDDPVLVLIFIAAMLPMAFLMSLRLDTRIDQEGIKAKFHPLGFTQKTFKWKEIDKVYLRKYRPVGEFGGWGIRVIGRKKAYNVAGNLGIQIVTTGKKQFLIGTQQPEAVKATLKNYEHKINRKITHK